MMTVKGETFDEDILKQVPAGAVHVQADADWGGDEDKRSTSGVIIYRRSDRLGESRVKWYLMQSASRKQTTVALSTV